MTDIFLIMFAAILTENFIFSRFYGICPFLGVSDKPSTALGMGMAVTFVMTLSSAATYAVYYLLLEPLGLEYLKTEKRSEITEKIKTARGFGDLSENAEYDEAKNEQAEVESKINQLMNMQKFTRTLTEDEIIDGQVCIGNTIEIQEVGEDEVEIYAVVSAEEIEMYTILNTDMDNVWYVVKMAESKSITVKHEKDLSLKQISHL